MTRHWTIRARILTLLLAPLVPLLAMLVFATSVALGPALNLRNAKTSSVDLAFPAGTVLANLQTERELSVIMVSSTGPNPMVLSKLTDARATTDSSYGTLLKILGTGAFRATANSETVAKVSELQAQLAKLTGTREAVDRGEARSSVMAYYDTAIEATFGLYGAIGSVDDHALSRESQTVVGMSEADEMLSREDALLAGPLTTGTMLQGDYTALVGTINTKRYLYQQATRYLSGAAEQTYAGIVASPAYARLTTMENAIVAHPNIGRAAAVDPTAWHNDFTTVSQQLSIYLLGEAEKAVNDTSGAASSRETRLFVIVGTSLAMLLLLIFFSLRIARSLIRRVAALRMDALTLAIDRIPSVVNRLRAGEAVDVEAETPPLEYGTDELGQLGDAFTRIQSTAIAAAAQESALRHGFNQVFLNIARRSQTLLHRQLALLDAMERRTTEPDDLEELFRIDHLATRMRRHAEDLVILAGAAPGRGWRNPVPVADVLRAAASEVEEYARVIVVGLPEVEFAGRAVSDVVHLLAELLENATLFSPPDTQVSLSGQVVPNGFAIEIEDRGLGMTPEAIIDANERLATPPEFDPANSSRLGLFVVARLAARHGIRVELRRSPYGGVTAVALIPGELIVAQGEITDVPEDIEPVRVPSQRRIGGSEYGRPVNGSSTYVSARSESDAVTGTTTRPALVTAGVTAGAQAPPPAAPTHEPSLRASTVAMTVDGLPQRVRQASLTRQLHEHAGLGRSITSPPERANGGAHSANTNRSPDEMRAMLSKFQDGMTLGRRDAFNTSIAAPVPAPADIDVTSSFDAPVPRVSDYRTPTLPDPGFAAPDTDEPTLRNTEEGQHHD